MHTDRLWRGFVLAGVGLMAVAACYRIPRELWRLAFEPFGHGAAFDVRFRFIEVHEWFAGRPVYGVVESADYPPASYLLLFPLAHWPAIATTRLVWALASVAALIATTVVAVRACPSGDWAGRAFAALLPLSSYAAAASIRVGQLGLLLLPLLAAGALVLVREERSWKRDALATLLLVPALVKPTLSAPFFWIAFFRGGWRPTLLIAGSYAALTIIASAFQDASLPTLVQGWLGQRGLVELASTHGNIHSWLAAAGLQRYLVPASLLLLLGLGAWTWRHRRADVWDVLAVAAIVARLWTYHRWYDDILIFFPIVALYRTVLATPATRGEVRWGLAVLALLWAFSIAPAQALAAPPPWSDLFKMAKTATWLAALTLLLARGWRAPPT